MADTDKLPGLSREETAQAIKSGMKGPVFYRVTVETLAFDGRALEREAGLAMMLGSPTLASVFSPDAHLVKILDTTTAFVSLDDALALPVLAAIEIGKAGEP
jgi:hypothetical protein